MPSYTRATNYIGYRMTRMERNARQGKPSATEPNETQENSCLNRWQTRYR